MLTAVDRYVTSYHRTVVMIREGTIRPQRPHIRAGRECMGTRPLLEKREKWRTPCCFSASDSQPEGYTGTDVGHPPDWHVCAGGVKV
jgi:hypothetical protein